MTRHSNIKFCTMLKNIFSLAVLSIGLLFLTPPQSYAAQEIEEIITQDPTNQEYMAALTIMKKPVYLKDAPDYWNSRTKKWRTHPLIRLGRVDLNNDSNPEIIAYPVEMVPAEADVLCKIDGACPHFIFTITRKNKIRLLSVIDAHAIEIDKSTHDGYQRLQVFTRNPDRELELYKYYDLYQYDKSNKLYEKLEY